MHLGQRCGGKRGGIDVQSGQLVAQFLLEGRADPFVGLGFGLAGELGQFGDVLGGQQVAAGRQQLPELDEGDSGVLHSQPHRLGRARPDVEHPAQRGGQAPPEEDDHDLHVTSGAAQASAPAGQHHPQRRGRPGGDDDLEHHQRQQPQREHAKCQADHQHGHRDHIGRRGALQIGVLAKVDEHRAQHREDADHHEHRPYRRHLNAEHPFAGARHQQGDQRQRDEAVERDRALSEDLPESHSRPRLSRRARWSRRPR
ncbi:hypothetical protein SDC9_90536 [bioreactor metagenome]|uniref:Uncharacterized protein n=1 Tax=bioreactor metagenome TaxID=1076179 RepID=A0A644ZS81_9ZZZZ